MGGMKIEYMSDMRVVPAPDGTIYLVDINGSPVIGAQFRVHVLGSKTLF